MTQFAPAHDVMKTFGPLTTLIIAAMGLLGLLWALSFVGEAGVTVGFGGERVLVISHGGGAVWVELLVGVYQPGVDGWLGGDRPYEGLKAWSKLPDPLIGTTGLNLPYQYPFGALAAILVATTLCRRRRSRA